MHYVPPGFPPLRWRGAQHPRIPSRPTPKSLCRYQIYVYLNLWSKDDPTDATLSIRQAMRSNDFALVEESDSYEESTDTYCIASTWLFRKEADSDGA